MVALHDFAILRFFVLFGDLPMIKKSAILSISREYRYLLSRIWKPEKGIICFIGLNPSTADENTDDRTITRCIRYADSWGYGGMRMLNLFAYRATKPNDMYEAHGPIGIDNDMYVKLYSEKSVMSILAWGAGPSYSYDKMMFNLRIEKVMPLIHNPHYLAFTKKGQPRHPLYLKKNLKPIKLVTQ